MEYDDLNPAQQEVFHAAAAEMQRIVWSHVVPVRLIRIVDDREGSYNTGTGTLIQLNGKHYLLTAANVFDELRQSKERGDEAYFLAQNAPLDSPIIAYSDSANDIVVLEVPDAVIGGIDAIAYEPVLGWPPRRVTSDDVVLLCGHPAFLRSEDSHAGLLFRDYSVMQPVTRAGENQFVLQLERENWISLGRAELPGAEVFLGGLSGAPVFAVDPLGYELVGIVSEIGDALPLLFIKSLAHLPPTFIDHLPTAI